MSMVERRPPGVMCDECGRTVVKLQRRYHGHGYCVTCYAREFEKRACPKCGGMSRLPRSSPETICEKCEHAHKPCIRCGKTDYRIGKVTVYGPVCNACAVHFREPRLCANCGALSNRLSRVKRLGIEEPVCPKCARIGLATCEACHRYRLLEKAPDGRMLCKACAESGDIPCPSCGNPMPAGQGKRCQVCYYAELLKKRIAMDRAAIASRAMADLFQQFGDWLGNAVGVHKAAITVHRYLNFFLELERQWDAVPAYSDLLGQHGASGLRRLTLPMHFLAAKGLIAVDQGAKSEDSERRRIDSIMNKLVASSQEREILEAYQMRLQEKVKSGHATLRSMRLALSPAAGLLLYAGSKSRMPPGQNELGAFLKQFPGQRAALSGFVAFLRERHKTEIALPPKYSKAAQARRKRLEVELLALMREGGSGKAYARKLVGTALAYFHGVPKALARNINAVDCVTEGDRGNWCFRLSGKDYWLPAEVVGRLAMESAPGRCEIGSPGGVANSVPRKGGMV